MALVNDTESNPKNAIPHNMVHNKPLPREQQFGLDPAMVDLNSDDENLRSHDSTAFNRGLAEAHGNEHLPQESLTLTQELDLSSHRRTKLLPSKLVELGKLSDLFDGPMKGDDKGKTSCECGYNAEEGEMVGFNISNVPHKHN